MLKIAKFPRSYDREGFSQNRGRLPSAGILTQIRVGTYGLHFFFWSIQGALQTDYALYGKENIPEIRNALGSMSFLVERPDETADVGPDFDPYRSDWRLVLSTNGRSKVGTLQKTVPTLTRCSGFIARIPIHLALEKQRFEGQSKGIHNASWHYGTEG